MQKVIHDLLRQLTLGIEKLRIEVEPAHGVAVGIALDEGVNLLVALMSHRTATDVT